METAPQPGKKPEVEKFNRLMSDLVNIKGLFEYAVPEEHQALWDECREEIAQLEAELQRGMEEAAQISDFSAEDTEYYEGFVAATQDQITEIYQRLSEAENLFYKHLPNEVLGTTRKIRKQIQGFSN